MQHKREQGFGTMGADVPSGRPTVWLNPRKVETGTALQRVELSDTDVEDAAQRWARFAPLLKRLFPVLGHTGGRIDSPLVAAQSSVAVEVLGGRSGQVLIKCDHDLPITGSIKARGGIYEVLYYAETIAAREGLLGPGIGYERLAEPDAREIFSQHTIAVGSTGNLGFSVGVMARAIGFHAEVHMSSDAKAWKKERLHQVGAVVVEHAGDYGTAVGQARIASETRRNCHFVDDENSVQLFLGYAVAARDLRSQLEELDVRITPEQPLVVYLPCGVGGAPGGITFGLKLLYGDAVHCVFVEPVQAPCMLVQLASESMEPRSVFEIGLSNRTEADGLAVPSASLLVANIIGEMVDGVVTVTDAELFRWARWLWLAQGLKLEPSAAAGFAAADPFLDKVDAADARLPKPSHAVHLVWTTGGALLPDDVFAANLEQGRLAGSQRPGARC